jgi:uncharacterized protein
MIHRINLVTLGVDDLDESILFYEDALGLPSMAQEGNVAIFNLDDSWLALLPKRALTEEINNSKSSPFEESLMQSLSFLTHHVTSKSEVDEVIAQAVEAGAKLFKKPTNHIAGGYSGYFTDLDGHLWQVVWNPYFYTEPAFLGGRPSLPN